MDCKWKLYHRSYNIWESDCGVLWDLNAGTPKDNGMNFCLKCGKELVEDKYGEMSDEDEDIE